MTWFVCQPSEWDVATIKVYCMEVLKHAQELESLGAEVHVGLRRPK
jgi:hypothetical protein